MRETCQSWLLNLLHGQILLFEIGSHGKRPRRPEALSRNSGEKVSRPTPSAQQLITFLTSFYWLKGASLPTTKRQINNNTSHLRELSNCSNYPRNSTLHPNNLVYSITITHCHEVAAYQISKALRSQRCPRSISTICYSVSYLDIT